MAAQKKKKARKSVGSPLRGILTHGCVLLTGLAGGYALAVFAPAGLPLPSGEDAPEADEGDKLAEEARQQREKLQKELERLRSQQEETEEEMAEMQIREILGENM